MKIARIFSVLFLLGLAMPAFSQSYITAAGIRVDKGINFTVQQRILDKWTAEGIVHTAIASKDIGLTVLVERHHRILGKGLNIYYGAGPHFFFQSDVNRQENQVSHSVAGISMIGGAELSLGRLNLSIDFKPELHLTGDTTFPFEWTGASVSARYILFKPKKKRFLDRFNGKNKKNNNKRSWKL